MHPYCPGGGIGRHTSLRGWRLQGCASSNLVLGTFYSVAQVAEVVDALVSGTSYRSVVQVRVLSWAHKYLMIFSLYEAFFFIGSMLRNILLLLCLSSSNLLLAQSPAIKADIDSLLVKFERQLYTLDPEKGDQIPVYFVQLDDLRSRLGELNLQEQEINDTALQKRLQKASYYFDSIQRIVLEKMKRIELVMYEEGLKAKTKGDTDYASTLFIRSLQHDPAFAPSAYELIKINLSPVRSLSCAEHFERYGKYIDSADNPYYYSLFRGLTSQVLDNILVYNSYLINRGLSADALSLLKEAVYFNRSHPSVNGDNKINNAYSLAHQGMYQSLITIADRAFSSRKWELANYYYAQARDYQQSNPAFIPNAALAQRGLENTASASRQKVITEKKQKKSKYSRRKKKGRHRHYKKTITPARKKPAIIAQPVKDTLVIHYLSLADSSLKQQDFIKSLQWCDSAQMHNTASKTVPEPSIRSRYAAAARVIVLDSLQSAYFLTWKNEIEPANRVLGLAKAYQQKYFLSDDQGVIRGIADLDERIRERQCFTAKADFEANIYRALSKFIRSDFLEGRDFLVKAQHIKNASPGCKLPDSLLQATLSQYSGLIHWQEHWNEAKQAWSVNNFQVFLTQYDSAFTIHQKEKLSAKGLQMKPLLNYLHDQQNMDAYREIAGIYLTDNKLDNAWELIKILKTEYSKPRQLESLLSKTGNLMALNDINHGNQYWKKILQSSGTWFKAARKTYKKTLRASKQ